MNFKLHLFARGSEHEYEANIQEKLDNEPLVHF